MTTYSRDEIDIFVEKHFGQPIAGPNGRLDIFEGFGITGDDCSIFMRDFGAAFRVEMEGYRWYFHEEEEPGLGRFFQILFPPPNKRVSRIPISTDLLLSSSNAGKWALEYPPHILPKRRYDVIASQCFGLVSIIVCVAVGLARWLS